MIGKTLAHDENGGRLPPAGLLAVAVLAWLAMIAMQSVVGPWDGYVPAHVRHEASRHAVGPFLHERLAPWFTNNVTPGTTRVLCALSLLLACALTALLVARLLHASHRERRRIGRWVVASVILMGALSFFNLPYLSNDLHLYRIHGVMATEKGLNPYVEIPSDHFPARELQGVPWSKQPSAYGPAALLLFRTASAAAPGYVGGLWALKVLMVLPWLALLLATRWWAGTDSAGGFTALVWLGLNPVLLLEIGQNGHLEGWIGSLLLLAVLLLRRRNLGRVVLAGACLGLASAFKLSELVVLGPIAAHLLRPDEEAEPAASRRPTGAVVLAAVVFVTLFLGYLPWWRGLETFAGLRAESEKILQSLYSVLIWAVPLQVPVVQALSLAGAAVAAGAGAWMRWRGAPLEIALVTTLILQAVLGRTFLHSWYLCPPLVLMALAQTYGPERRRRLATRTRFGLLDDGFWLTASVAALFGHYAVTLVTQSLGAPVQALAVGLMVLPPLTVAFWKERDRRASLLPVQPRDRARREEDPLPRKPRRKRR